MPKAKKPAGDPRPSPHAPTIRRAEIEIPEWFDTESIGLPIAARWKNRIELRTRFEESIEALSEQMHPAARVPEEWIQEWLARWADASYVGIIPCHSNLSPDQLGKSVDDVAAVVDMHLKTRWILDAPTARCEAIEYPHRVHGLAIPKIPEWRGPCIGAPAPLSWQGPRLHVVAILRRIAELAPPTADSMEQLRSMAWYTKEGEELARDARERLDDWAKRQLRRAIPAISLNLGIPPAAIADKSLDLDVVIERVQEWVIRARETSPTSPRDKASRLKLDVKPLRERQVEILEMLRGRAMSQKQLASAIGVNRQQMDRDYLKPLMELGRVKHATGAGYYRPDDPPPDWNAALQ